MSVIKTLWGLLFRLFPSPARIGLRRIGEPGRDSPVLVTCNFDLTVKRLSRALRGRDVWLLVSESKGVNVWCAAGAQELNTHSVVSVVKTSGIADLVDHRTLVLPPLGAPGIRAADVEEQTGWSTLWGPVYAEDIPRFLDAEMQRDAGMKRVSYRWRERLDTALGSLFPFYLAGAVGFAIFGRGLLLDYLAIGASAYALFFLACPWLPGKRGLTKALGLIALLAVALLCCELLLEPMSPRLRADLIMAMVVFAVWGAELGGLASTLPSDLDPLLARMGVGAVGNTRMAGTVRTELLNGYRLLTLTPDRCEGCGQCAAVCPEGVWDLDDQGHAVLARLGDCTACTACVHQCQSGAIRAAKVGAHASHGGAADRAA